MDLTFLDKLNWVEHDGINFSMINDYVRNSFYDNILKDTVKDKICLEIGFGTGLLSILALKYGAKKIVAFESDPERYLLGKLIIDELRLHNKIELYCNRYDFNQLKEHPNVDLIFCETVDQHIWGEGIYNSIPRKENILFVPGNYFFELQVIEITDMFSQRLFEPLTKNKFNPGIDIDQNFVNVINNLIEKKYNTQIKFNNLESGIHQIDAWNENFRQLYTVVKTSKFNPVIYYEVDANKKNFLIKEQYNLFEKSIDEIENKIEFTLKTTKWKNKNIILLPRIGMKHKEHLLYLDNACWGPVWYPVLLIKPTKNILLNHNLQTGIISMEEIN
jgi:predicted RNA methylase